MNTTNDPISNMLMLLDDNCKKHIINFLRKDVMNRIKHINLPLDVKKKYVLDEVKIFNNILNEEQLFIRFSGPYYMIYNDLEILVKLIFTWIEADLNYIYYYSEGSINIIDRMDMLHKNCTTKYINKINKFMYDVKIILKLLENGLIILNIFDEAHYICFFKNQHNQYVGVSTLEMDEDFNPLVYNENIAGNDLKELKIN